MPPYTYRDQSLEGLANGDYFAVQRQRQFLLLRWQVKFLFVVVTVACASLLPLHYTLLYHSYQQGTCTITDKQVQESDSTDKSGDVSRWYTPLVSYNVHTIDGKLISTTGIDGPFKNTGYGGYDPDSAQAIIDRYQVGQVTPCWYNPIKPETAFLAFYGYTFSDALTTFFLCLLCFAILAAFVYWLFDWTVWRLYALEKRGVVTHGTVLRSEKRGTKGSIAERVVSIIGFHTAEEPKREQHITVNGKLVRNRRVYICYDPFYPRYRCYGEWPTGQPYQVGALGIVSLFLVTFIIMLALWLAP